MGRRKKRAWALKWCSFFTSIAVLALTGPSECAAAEGSSVNIDDNNIADDDGAAYNGDTIQNIEPDCDDAQFSHKYDNLHKRDFVLVSTLDGKISALDLNHDGEVLWSLDAGTGPLLSSSIDKLMMMNEKGKQIRLVPSLNGGLYSWDGGGVEALPFTAESLLKSSFKLGDDYMFVGGKETQSYGISARTGQLRYMCSTNGCVTFGEEAENEDIIMLIRDHQTIRAVEPRTGGEKWNFSVGHHDVKYLKQLHDNTNSKPPETCEEDDEECYITDYDDYDVFFGDEEDYRVDPNLKFVVSDGIIIALSRQNPHKVLWQQKLPSSIASAWTLKDGEVDPLDLFEANNVPALSMSDQAHMNVDLVDSMNPMLYMGMYHKQMYIQESIPMSEKVRKAASTALDENESGQKLIAGPRVSWRPYLATAPSRTPAMITHVTGNEEVCEKDPKMKTNLNQYPFDSGYYLFTDQTPVKLVKDSHRTRHKRNMEGNESIGDDDESQLNFWIAISISEWWKEILQVSILLSITIDIMANKFKRPITDEDSNTREAIPPPPPSSSSPQQQEADKQPASASSDPTDYKSRYLDDFEQQLCLGRGGFGIVFQAKNKLDDSEYAVKRITLPNREKARGKVLREVKALAKLEHNNIVRYYATWLETPPVGWQDEQDKLLGDSETTTPFNTYTEYTGVKDAPPVREQPNLKLNTASLGSKDSDEQSKPFGGGDSETVEYTGIAGQSSGFVPTTSEDESGSWSVDFHGDDNRHADVEASEGSFGIDFREPSKSSSEETIGDVPFGHYSNPQRNDSYSVVFEDSGCGDKLSSDSNPTSKQDSTNSSSLAGVVVQRPGGQSSNGDRTPQNKQSSEADASYTQPIQRAYLYIQMQLCKRETLKDWLLEHTVDRPSQQILHIFQQIVSAVHYVHDQGMIHRDLKPSNIFFSMDGLVKIGDFGLVTAIDAQPATGQAVEQAPERKHTDQVGTQLYMSPEQIAGKRYGHKVDIFTLGLIFFEMMHPFSTQSERIQVMMGAKRQTFPSDFVKDNPAQARFAEWLLSPTPHERPSAEELTESESYNELYRDFKPPHIPRKRNTSSSVD